MVALAFAPGDGTGDDKTYPVGSLTMHQRIMFANKSWRVHPRKKSLPDDTPVMVEGMIPLFGTIPGQ